MTVLEWINYILGALFMLMYAYQGFYMVVSILGKHKKQKEAVLHRIGVLICARNEQSVIGNLIESVKKQDYPASHLQVFVCADNCTDETASVSREHGAIVYERHNLEKIGKGFALKELISHIDEDYGKDAYEAYLILDADNILENNFVTELNKTYSNGYRVVTSYRDSKNYGDNWVSAGYSLQFMREAKYLNNARMLLGTSCAVSGTGFMFDARLLDDGGWKWFLLTEDTQFTVHHALQGDKIGYAPNAVLYDEQPTSFLTSITQRMRWAKGQFQVYGRYGWKLFTHIFKRGGFAAYDLSVNIFYTFLLSTLSILYNIVTIVVELALGESILGVLTGLGVVLSGVYLGLYFMGLLTTITEWKRIQTPVRKKIWFTFTFPIFMMSYFPIAIYALFVRVHWKPIKHTKVHSLEDIYNQAKK